MFHKVQNCRTPSLCYNAEILLYFGNKNKNNMNQNCQRIKVTAVRNAMKDNSNNEVVEMVKIIRVDSVAVLVPKRVCFQ